MERRNTQYTWVRDFLWIIDNFNGYLRSVEKEVTSPSFYVYALKDIDWKISLLIPIANSQADGKMAMHSENNKHQVKLERGDSGPPSVLIDCKFTVCNLASEYLTLSTEFLKVSVNYHCLFSVKEFDRSKDTSKLSSSQQRIILRCRMQPVTSQKEPTAKRLSIAGTEMYRESFVWSIQEFSGLGIGDLRTTRLVNASLEDEPFTLEGAFEGNFEEDAVLRCHILQNCYAPSQRQLLYIRMSLLDRFGGIAKVSEGKHWFEGKGQQRWTFPKSITRRELLDGKEDYLPEDVLSLLCEYSVSDCDEFESVFEWNFGHLTIDDLSGQSDGTSLSTLQEDLEILYHDETFTDFKLRAGDRTFLVHKFILSARSPIFKAMFGSDASTSEFHVTDLDAETLDRTLLFMYKGTFESNWEMAMKLYYTAIKFEIPSLKEECTCFLECNMSISNVCDVLSMADKHMDRELKFTVHKFLYEHINEICGSKEWNAFEDQNVLLARETMHLLLTNGSFLFKEYAQM